MPQQNEIVIAPSLLSADFLRLGEEVEAIKAAGAAWAHVDVMDGHFAPNLTFGVPILRQLVRQGTLPADVHLMISNPLAQLPWFIACKPYSITVHWEALDVSAGEAKAASSAIRAAGIKAAVSINPETDADVLANTLHLWDMVLVMGVHPGFSGQSYIPGTEEKVARVARLARDEGADIRIQVDGGMSPQTAPLVAAAGADAFVAGSAVFGAEDYAEAISAIKDAAQAARGRARG